MRSLLPALFLLIAFILSGCCTMAVARPSRHATRSTPEMWIENRAPGFAQPRVIDDSVDVPLTIPPNTHRSTVRAWAYGVRADLNLEAWVGFFTPQYSVAGAKLVLEVVDGTRLLCRIEEVILERWITAAEIDDGRGFERYGLQCSFLTGAPLHPRARVSLVTWTAARENGTTMARIVAEVNDVEVRELHCPGR